MKPLLSVKVTRDSRPKDWVASGDHLTAEGVEAFRQRMKDYAKVKPTAQATIRQLRK
jgi:hypothetical protein